MRTVSATEAKQGLAAVLDAAQREPVVIQRQKRDVAVMLSMQEYERLVAVNIAEFQDFCDRIGVRASWSAASSFPNPSPRMPSGVRWMNASCWFPRTPLTN